MVRESLPRRLKDATIARIHFFWICFLFEAVIEVIDDDRFYVYMDLLKQRILKDGIVIGADVLKVDSFLNHCIDVSLSIEMGKEFHRLFANCAINKILTVEASGIGLACLTAQFFNCNVVFAKKSPTRNCTDDVYFAPCHSFTHDTDNILRVSKKYISAGDKVLIIDDFLANGEAVNAMMDIVSQAGAETVGVGIAIEKGFQDGGDALRSKGIKVESLAIVEEMNEKGIRFRN